MFLYGGVKIDSMAFIHTFNSVLNLAWLDIIYISCSH